MRSYDQMLDEMIFKTKEVIFPEGYKLRKDSLDSLIKDEALADSMTLDEILYRNDLKLPKKKK